MKSLASIVKEEERKRIDKLLIRHQVFAGIMDDPSTSPLDKMFVLTVIFNLSLVEARDLMNNWETKGEDETFLQVYLKSVV